MKKNVAIARILTESKKYRDSLTIFQKCTEEMYVEQMATCMFLLGDFKKCGEFCQVHLSFFNNNEVLQNRWLESYIADEKYADAFELAKEHERFKTRKEEIKCMVKQTEKYGQHMKNNEYSKALEELEALIKCNPYSLKLLEKKLEVLVCLGHYKEILLIAENEKLMESVRSIEFLYFKAIAYYYLNDSYQQKELFKKIFKKEKNHERCMRFIQDAKEYELEKNKARIEFSNRHYRECKKTCSDIVRVFKSANPEKLSEIYYKKGLCCFNLEEMDDAVTCFEQSALIYNRNYEAYRMLSHSCLKKEDLVGSLDNIGKAQQIATNDYNINRDFEIITSIYNLKKNEYEEKQKRQKERDERRRIREEKKKNKLDQRFNNHYSDLGLDPAKINVSITDIQHAYNQSIYTFHPDNATSDEERLVLEEKTKKINTIYEILNDENKRETYNKTLHIESPEEEVEDPVSDEEMEEAEIYKEKLYTIYMFERNKK